MSETTDKTAAPKAQEPAAKAQAEPAQKQGAHSSAAHGGAYTLVRELTAASGGQEPPPDKLTHVFRKSDYAHPVNDAQKARALTALQQQYGNRYVQRVLSGGASEPPRSDSSALVQRQEAQGASGGEESSTPQLGQGGGRPLDSGTRDLMGSRFGQDFAGVRVHDDGAAHSAARALNADAFTTGRDIYFSQGAYNPSTQAGQKLLAHELAHVAQQSRGAAGAAPQGFRVSHPTDPLERQADAASEAVMRGEMFPALTSSTAGTFFRQAGGGAAPAPAPGGGASTDGGADDFTLQIAGTAVVLPVKNLLKKAVPGNKLKVPNNYLKVPVPFFKLTEASLDLDDNKMPTGATVALAVAKSPLEGTGSVSVDKRGNVTTGSAHVVFNSSRIPGLKQTELDVTVASKEFSFETSIDFELPRVTGNLRYKYADQKHSGKGRASYEGSKLKGELEIIMSEAGLISGSGMLEMELFKGLKGEVEVAVDEKKNIGVKGKLSVPGEVELFPEKKHEKSFFNFEKKFPIWGITIPVIDVNVGIFAEIHAGAGFRAKFGPGVLRDIALTGEFGTDPEAATEFGLGGEFYVPAAAEVVANVGGGIGLGLAVADITGGIEAVGVAGLYTALSVRPNFKYSGGKYTISGMAELAGVAQLKFGINAFAKIDVGVWLFKGTVWRKDWTLAEWVWNTGLNIALRAKINYTLGDDFAPDISFETGEVPDPEKFIKDAMPESGSPVPAPPKPAVPEKGTLTVEGAQGEQAGGAAETPGPPTPGSPQAKTQKGDAGEAATGGTKGPQPEGAASPEHEAQVQAGLKALDDEAKPFVDNNEIEKEEAEKVAASVKSKHPVFKSLTVVDGGSTWDFDYVASPGKTKKGPAKDDEAKPPPGYEAKLNDAGNVEGSFDEGKFDWSGYPPSAATRHPANKYSGNNDTAVPKPSGKYEITGRTGGYIHTDKWRDDDLFPAHERYKDQLKAQGKAAKKAGKKDEEIKKELLLTINFPEKVNQAWVDERTLGEIYEQGAKYMVQRDYWNEYHLEYYPDLTLTRGHWEEHHIHPVGFGGGQNDDNNMQYLRKKEHSPFTTFFNERQRLLQKALGAKKKK